MAKNIGIIFAGGVGKRMGIKQIPKQFLIVDEKPIIVHTLEYFQQHKNIDEIYISCVEDWMDHMKEIIEKYDVDKVKAIVKGGETAQDSIYNALSEAGRNNSGDSIVLIHDGVRPFISEDLITDIIDCTTKNGNAITCTPCFETIIISDDGDNVGDVPLRKETYSAQAPQAFHLKDILSAHDEIRKINPTYEDVVDQCTLMRILDKPVYMVKGNRGNIKITKPEDVYILEALMEYRKGEEIMGVSYLDTKQESN